MAKIHTLTVEPMTENSFKPFGEVWSASEKPSDRRILFPTSYSHDGQSTVHVIWQPQGGLKFDQLERHFGVTQSFVQLSGGSAVVPQPRLTQTTFMIFHYLEMYVLS